MSVASASTGLHCLFEALKDVGKSGWLSVRILSGQWANQDGSLEVLLFPPSRLLGLPPSAGRLKVVLCCGTSLVLCALQPGLMLLPNIICLTVGWLELRSSFCELYWPCLSCPGVAITSCSVPGIIGSNHTWVIACLVTLSAPGEHGRAPDSCHFSGALSTLIWNALQDELQCSKGICRIGSQANWIHLQDAGGWCIALWMDSAHPFFFNFFF